MSRAKKQLTDWYTNGWGYSYIKCEYEGYEDSCGGYLGEVSNEDIQDMAVNVADQMIDYGFQISNMPKIQTVTYRKRKKYQQISDFNTTNI